MTVAMSGETVTGATGENRDLVGASTSFPPKMENPTARSGDEPEKNEWEPDASDALDRGEAMEANASTEAERKTAANKGTARRMGPWMLPSLPRKFGPGRHPADERQTSGMM